MQEAQGQRRPDTPAARQGLSLPPGSPRAPRKAPTSLISAGGRGLPVRCPLPEGEAGGPPAPTCSWCCRRPSSSRRSCSCLNVSSSRSWALRTRSSSPVRRSRSSARCLLSCRGRGEVGR